VKYLKVFTDFADKMDMLGDAERGRLFTAMLEYARTGEAPDLRGNERFLWSSVKSDIDRQADSYNNICEINKRIATERNGASRSVTKRHGASQDKDKDKDNTLTGIPPYSPPKWGERFEVFWKAYPRKTGKDAARKAFAKRNPSQELLDKMLAAIEQQKQSAQWQKNNGQFIPLPTTWLNQGRWDDEVQITHSEPVAEDRYANLRRLYLEVTDEPAGNH
jgi:hypothetical protein